ncbi:hypothetical protein [Clostridium estertheticum]|uniref:hypothetical protein n=1 Tax=Clostridium estertheticum TaxID=238834 RepID=UPI001C6F1D05|nr:hypothetical protein [Clostridium estertheticum]MBW9154315.1 hypothetical protein [Clostridium estertheticum]WLC86644.1 hypothetical protein KTC97_21645 [Clostridium estertheticum]
MGINKKDLRKQSRAFRTIANRTINAHFEESNSILKMFIDYIDNNSLISSYINSIVVDDFDVTKQVKEISSNYKRAFLNTGSCAEEEIVYTYKILKYMVDQKVSITSISRSYANSTAYQDKVKGFGDRIILPFVNHIEAYITDISIDMGFDEEAKYVITVSGGQVNMAKDQATINATQYNGINADELDTLVRNIKSLLTDEITLRDQEIINDNIEVLQEELKKENFKKGFVKTAISGLQGVFPKISESIKLTSAITSIITFAIAVL